MGKEEPLSMESIGKICALFHCSVDDILDHIANERIDIDLDDGLKVNYEKVQTDHNGKKFKILAPIK